MDSEIGGLYGVLDKLSTEIALWVHEIINVQYVNWEALQWHKTGPGTLFEEFRKAGAWADSIGSRILDFEQKKNDIVYHLSSWKAQLKDEVERIQKTNAKQWVMSGYAYQEREAFARIDAGDKVHYGTLIDARLERISSSLTTAKAKVAQLNSFRADARIAATLMNFGNQLGELK